MQAKRANAAERAKRVNHAFTLLKKKYSSTRAIDEIMKQYSISHRQAQRYVNEAEKVKKLLPIPEPTVVFTVKLPVSLVHHLRELPRPLGQSLSDMVSQALYKLLESE
jgi:hypothetical protein